MGPSILVVEDDEILADNIRTYLGLKGFEVTVCHSAELALEQVKQGLPDAVLTDNSLPGMNGHELLRALITQAPELKVIMMTGYGNVEDAVLARRAARHQRHPRRSRQRIGRRAEHRPDALFHEALQIRHARRRWRVPRDEMIKNGERRAVDADKERPAHDAYVPSLSATNRARSPMLTST